MASFEITSATCADSLSSAPIANPRVTPEAVSHYVRRAHELRSEMLRDLARRAAARVSRAVGKPAAPNNDCPDGAAHA